MTEIQSAVSGKVKAVCIKAGQMITEDDEVAVVEAMGTEIVVYGKPGIVKEIKVSIDETVGESDVIAIVL